MERLDAIYKNPSSRNKLISENVEAPKRTVVRVMNCGEQYIKCI